ncbi:hypothetical protein B0H11DRAFT_1908702 [Mycena galericulata]|nr:hypothetical protein B0H11DRAFT_1908702 [Mycena galericulata]
MSCTPVQWEGVIGWDISSIGWRSNDSVYAYLPGVEFNLMLRDTGSGWCRFRPCVIIIPPTDGTQEAECGVPRACGAATLEEVGSFMREPDKCRGLVTQARRGNAPGFTKERQHLRRVRFLRAPRYAWKITELVSRIVNNRGQLRLSDSRFRPRVIIIPPTNGTQEAECEGLRASGLRLRSRRWCEVFWIGVEDPLTPPATCAKVFHRQLASVIIPPTDQHIGGRMRGAPRAQGAPTLEEQEVECEGLHVPGKRRGGEISERCGRLLDWCPGLLTTQASGSIITAPQVINRSGYLINRRFQSSVGAEQDGDLGLKQWGSLREARVMRVRDTVGLRGVMRERRYAGY